MMNLVIALLSGLTFGIGLAISGMTDTQVVLGFLDIAGDWNPALLAVMTGALAITLPGFWLLRKRPAPILTADFYLPTKRAIDRKLLVGSALFGAGWGLYGYCPGPALASLLTLDWQPVAFVLAMSAGMLIEPLFNKQA
jgi:uncharacterized membrane protein YedE/YeeE